MLWLETVAQKSDVFGILPNGFKKSLNRIFQLLPRVLKDISKLKGACVLNNFAEE